MRNAQYYIDGELVTCTVYNEYGLAFYATATIEDGDAQAAMKTAFDKAEQTKKDYITE